MNKGAIAADMTERQRQWLVIGGGGAAILGLSAYIASSVAGSVDEAPPTVDPSPLSMPVPVAVQPVLPAAAPLPAQPSLEGLILYGVSGGGPAGAAAIIGTPTGRQRAIAVGRDYAPGLKVTEVGTAHAILSGPNGATRLDLNRFGEAGPPQPRALAGPAPAASPATGPTGSLETLKLRLGLAPRKAGGRITGYTLRPGADLPVLRRAGLRPGDVLVALNGQAIESEEKIMELPGEIAGSFTAVFEYERGGRRMKSSLDINPRR